MEAISVVLVALYTILALCSFGLSVWIWVTIVKLITKVVKKYLDD